MKKYYIELYPNNKEVENSMENGYALQSCWFEKKEDAIKWANSIDYKDRMYDIWLMSSEWDDCDDRPIDIKLEKFLK